MASSVKNSCKIILSTVRASCLHFCLNETPHSIYITVRKRFSNSLKEETTKIKINDVKVSALEEKLKSYEKEVAELKVKAKEAIKNENEIKKLRREKDLIEKELKDSENDKKAVKKLLTNVEKENHDLKNDKVCATEKVLVINWLLTPKGIITVSGA